MLRRLYSQAGQDLWVMRDVFGYMTGGFFVEIGAADGVAFSNSLALERYLGWSGLCVEPDPAAFAELRHNRKATCVNACLDDRKGDVAFTSGAGLFGGIVAADTDNAISSKTVSVPAITFGDLINQYSIPSTIDYLSIDVEGAEDRVMATFPFSTHRFLAATIERPGNALRQKLADEGYVLVAEVPNLDTFYLHPEICVSYGTRIRLASHSRSIPAAQRLFDALSWGCKNGLRAAVRRM